MGVSEPQPFNKILYLDERFEDIDHQKSYIRPLELASFNNNNVCSFTVNNGMIYYIDEQYKNDHYEHIMNMFNSQNDKIINDKEIKNYSSYLYKH